MKTPQTIIKSFFIGALLLNPFFTTVRADEAQEKPDVVHVPGGLPAGKNVPLVVVLHGCATSAESIEDRTRWSELADRKKFIVLYPNLRNSKNKINCWDWYDPQEQTRDGQEVNAVMQSIQSVIHNQPVDSRQVFVAGVSAGAAIAANLTSCFPEVFAGAAFHSGMSFGLAQTWQKAFEVAKKGPADNAQVPVGSCSPYHFQGEVMVVHGTNDDVMNPKNATRLVSDYILSQAKSVTKTSAKYSPKTKLFEFPKYSYTVTDYKIGNRLIGKMVMVDGLGHAWSGGKWKLLSDPRGPDATTMMWDFFQETSGH